MASHDPITTRDMLGRPSPWGDRYPRMTWLARKAPAQEFLDFGRRLRHHADIWPILAASGLGFVLLTYTGWENLARNPDVYVRHDWMKTSPAHEVQPTVDFQERQVDQAVAYHEKSMFAKFARLRHWNNDATGGAGWDTRILSDWQLDTRDKGLAEAKRAQAQIHAEEEAKRRAAATGSG